MRRLDRLVKAYPDVYHQTGEDEISKTYSVKKSFITFSKPRKLSDNQMEQKQKLMQQINKQ